MSYELHIVRFDSDGNEVPIPLEEWQDVIAADRRLRPMQPVTVTNPQTGETIQMAGGKMGDADCRVPLVGFLSFLLPGEWQPLFRWSSPGSIVFKGVPILSFPITGMKGFLRKLARSLDARIVGDEGEPYDW
jgi:hypothetical protein